MKKKVFCAGALALWFLLFCTFFSLRVEEMMTPRVVSVRPSKMANSTKEVLSLDCLFQNETGEVCLYSLYEGVGWEDGQRAALTPPDQYEIDLKSGNVPIRAAGPFVGGAVKPPLLGEQVRLIESGDPVSDHWLALCPGGTGRQKPLSNGAELEAQTENLLMVSVPQGFAPFMENRAKFQLFSTTVFDKDPETVYSLNEVESFLRQTKLLALLGGILLFVLLLWAWSCFLLRNPRRHKKLLAVNGGIYALSLAAIPLLLSRVDLPQSILPQQVIVDISHYQAEFGAIFSALRQLAGQGSQTAQDLLSAAGETKAACFLILAAGALLSAVVVLVEQSARIPRGKHAARAKR